MTVSKQLLLCIFGLTFLSSFAQSSTKDEVLYNLPEYLEHMDFLKTPLNQYQAKCSKETFQVDENGDRVLFEKLSLEVDLDHDYRLGTNILISNIELTKNNSSRTLANIEAHGVWLQSLNLGGTTAMSVDHSGKIEMYESRLGFGLASINKDLKNQEYYFEEIKRFSSIEYTKKPFKFRANTQQYFVLNLRKKNNDDLVSLACELL